MRNLEETKKLICYTLDALAALNDLQRNPQGKSVGIFDLRGQREAHMCSLGRAVIRVGHTVEGDRLACHAPADISMDCLDFGALKAVFELLQMHYPERWGCSSECRFCILRFPSQAYRKQAMHAAAGWASYLCMKPRQYSGRCGRL